MGTDVTGTYHTEDECTKGDLFVVLDPETFAGPSFGERVDQFVSELKSGERAAGFDEIRLPGESSVAAADADTVTVDDDVWAEVQNISENG